jgi:hypothetical protein
MLEKVDEFLDANKKKQSNQKDAIKEVLKSLKKKHNACKSKMKKEKNADKRKKMEKELDIIWVQRRKGLRALKKLMKKK